MNVTQKLWSKQYGWKDILGQSQPDNTPLVLVFGSRSVCENQTIAHDLRAFYPKATIVMCSTAGEILGTNVFDDTCVASAFSFTSSHVKVVTATIPTAQESEAIGEELIGKLPLEGLVHVVVISDGLFVNGTALVKGITKLLPPQVSLTGGLAGDGADFKKTYVGLDGIVAEKTVIAIGFYGPDLKVSYGSLGGWDPFGVDRVITKSKDNVLYELDGKPALALYKLYLGEKASGLPGTGLLFPLCLKTKSDSGQEELVVRTVLSVNDQDQSMTFAGDMPEGTCTRLMKANVDRLIDGSGDAAAMSMQLLGGKKPEFALLISCVGRKLVLKERIEEEVEVVRTVIGEQAAISGFYSYGEICPTPQSGKKGKLHNQSMTITLFCE